VLLVGFSPDPHGSIDNTKALTDNVMSLEMSDFFDLDLEIRVNRDVPVENLSRESGNLAYFNKRSRSIHDWRRRSQRSDRFEPEYH
jgi:hypothetical protein